MLIGSGVSADGEKEDSWLTVVYAVLMTVVEEDESWFGPVVEHIV